MKSVMQHQFSQVPKAEIPRSTFDRSFGHKTTFNAGILVPFLLDEALPGDVFEVKSTLFSRLATPIFPVMDNMFMDTFFFACPLRLIDDTFKKMMGEQDNPTDSVDYLAPTISCPAGGWTEESLEDYFGLPINVDGLTVNAYFHRAYNLTWNQWFRDQNLQQSQPVPKDAGPDDPTNYKLMRRGKRFDYFSSCLPWPQKGDAVSIPLGTSAPIYGANMDFSGADTATNRVNIYDNPGGSLKALKPDTSLLYGHNVGSGTGELRADLSSATAATINSLRQAFQVQKLLERDARGGTRYVELVKAHFGVTSPDARQQRVEYLGGGSTPVGFNAVQQTSSTDATTPQGNLAAYSTAVAHNHGFKKGFTEHCVILGLVCVRADLNYQQGIPRMFSRSTKLDFYWPALSHIGEQAVLNKEIYADGSANDDLVFGYQERHAEYRYKPSQITGQFRSRSATPLDSWHLAQDFSTLPTLGATFIEENPPVDRVIAVPSEPHFLFDSYTQMKCTRPMPVYGVPGLIDHF